MPLFLDRVTSIQAHLQLSKLKESRAKLLTSSIINYCLTGYGATTEASPTKFHGHRLLMSNVQVPSKVAHLLRRLVNLVSGLSLSHQYLTRKSRSLVQDVSNSTSGSELLSATSLPRNEAVSGTKDKQTAGTDLGVYSSLLFLNYSSPVGITQQTLWQERTPTQPTRTKNHETTSPKRVGGQSLTAEMTLIPRRILYTRS